MSTDNRNIVMFKGSRSGISIILDSGASFTGIKQVLAEKVSDAARFFGDSSSAITFVGRVLSEAEEAELVEIIVQNSGLDISFITSTGRPIKPQSTPASESAAEIIARSFDGTEHTTKFCNGTLRSGSLVRYRGSVVVLGDVNPGAEILAEGNVIVLGSIKGLVQAGSMGDESCFIFALNLMPLQLRIAGRIYAPENGDTLLQLGNRPLRAYVEDKKMYIRQLD